MPQRKRFNTILETTFNTPLVKLNRIAPSGAAIVLLRHYYHLHDDEAQRQMQRINFVGGSAAKGAREGTALKS